MHPENKNILAVNGGSSSIKFSLYTEGTPLAKWLTGKIERIGLDGTELTYTNTRNQENGRMPVEASDLSGAAAFLLGWLDRQEGATPLAAVGHRVVQGLEHTQACRIDDALLDELERISAYDPEHLPGELSMIRLMRQQAPELMQVACFDTAFHTTLPRLARLLPIPRRYEKEGLHRYGFHGLSYSYILEELTRVAGPATAHGRLVMAHLGNGASLAAVKDGVCVDTTMGFTPAGGIVMGTRPGDLDPGVLWWLVKEERFDAGKLNHFIHHECGLLGISETSSDMQDLLARESADERAADAVGLFCYQVSKAIGAYSAVLGGLDTLVFTGGIGEKSAVIRSRVCAGLGYLGIRLDQRANDANERYLSAEEARAGIYAIPTDEEWMIARSVLRLLEKEA
jgi:acetate kinase